jgi:hypothetical protein
MASPTGLNVIPTTDLVPLHNWVGGLANSNTNFFGVPFYRQPIFTEQTQFGLESWLEAGVDYAQTPDITHANPVANIKGLFLIEDDKTPNLAFGVMNLTTGESPTYYITASKTLNYDQEQEERYKAHNRRNRKVLGRRVHVGMMLDGHGNVEPFAGSDLQVNDNLVFQTDWIGGTANGLTGGVSYVFPDQKTIFTPALIFSNYTKRVSGLSLSITRQFP